MIDIGYFCCCCVQCTKAVVSPFSYKGRYISQHNTSPRCIPQSSSPLHASRLQNPDVKKPVIAALATVQIGRLPHYFNIAAPLCLLIVASNKLSVSSSHLNTQPNSTQQTSRRKTEPLDCVLFLESNSNTIQYLHPRPRAPVTMASAIKSALPSHLKPNKEDGEANFERRHGKTRSHMASTPIPVI